MTENMTNGILVVIDGIDGVGKTTQVDLLLKSLMGANIDAVHSKEPTAGKWGKLIRDSAINGRLPLEQEMEYFIKDRQEHIKEFIKPSLEAGKVVILDRYYYSTISYQGARGADVPAVRNKIEGLAIKPDIAFILNCDVSIALDRIKHSRGDIPNEFEKADYLKDVQNVFLSLCEIEREVIKVNAQNSIGHIHAYILDNLIKGPLKKKLCGKKYECDCMYCVPRMTDSCEWLVAKSLMNPIQKPEN